MNNSLKGAFFSGLVFPGLGQVILKRYKRGAALILTVSACMLVIIIKAVQQAFAILQMIESAGGSINMSTITDTAAKASTASDSLIIKLLLLLILFCWIFGIIDAYRIGRIKDSQDGSLSQSSHGNDS